MPKSFLPYGRQSVDDKDIEAVVRVLKGDWLTQGPAVEEFEQKLSQFVNAKYTVACATGTAALHLALLAAGLKKGEAAIVPAVTFLATANAVRMTGADVVFADVDPDTGRMNAETLRQAFEAANHNGQKIKAVLPVHLSGAVTQPEELWRISGQHNAIVIEDACHALSGEYSVDNSDQVEDFLSVGSCQHSQMACFSFHPVKPMTTAEGGAITTNDPVLAEEMRKYRSHGIIRDAEHFTNMELAKAKDGTFNPWYYEMHEIGWNYRISDLQCALGITQLEKLPQSRNNREQINGHYRELLANYEPNIRIRPEKQGDKSAHHLFVVLIDFKALATSRNKVMQALRERQIGTQVHYIPVPAQPYYQELYGKKTYPGAEQYYSQCLSLPLFVGMTRSDVEYVVSSLVDVLWDK